MTAQELKNSILQLAVQGKLVPQCKEDEPASELLKRIRADKEKVGKKEKPLPEITEDEIPFEIPENWEWVRLGEIGSLLSGYAFKSTEYEKSGVQVVRISDLADDTVSTKDAVYYSKKDELNQYLVVKNSFLICLTGSIGKMAWVQDNIPRYLNQRVGMYISYDVSITPYLWLFLHSPYVINQWIASKTSTNGNIKNSNVTEALCPIPPLAEQERIVAKIEELMPMVEEYGKAEEQLTKLNTEFPDELRKSILQQAVQGKLTERDPADEPASELLKRIKTEKEALMKSGKIKKEKPLPEITEDEKPFDIPDTWEWVRFTNVIDIASNLVQPNEYHDLMHIAPDNIQKGTGKLLVCQTVKEDKVASPNHLFCKGQLIYSKIRPLLRKVVIAPFDGLCSADMYPLKTCLNTSYVKYVMLSEIFNWQVAVIASNRVKMPKINQNELGKIVIPLPPLAEQKRIVKRVEETLALCDGLK